MAKDRENSVLCAMTYIFMMILFISSCTTHVLAGWREIGQKKVTEICGGWGR